MAQEDYVKIAAPPEGWTTLEFVDGYRAQSVGGTEFVEDGQEKVKLLLAPHPELIKRYKISQDKLTDDGCIEMIYPKNMIITLNEDDPARKIRFCMLTFEGKETSATKEFLGYAQNKVIEKLREKCEGLRVHNATLKMQNSQLQNNVPKFIENNFTAIAGKILPLLDMQRRREEEEKEREKESGVGR